MSYVHIYLEKKTENYMLCDRVSMTSFDKILSLTNFNKSTTLLLVLLSMPLSSLIPLLFSNLYNGSKSMNVLNISFSSVRTKFSLLPNLPTYYLSITVQLHTALAHHRLSPSFNILIFLFKNHKSLILVRVTLFLKSTSCFIPSASC